MLEAVATATAAAESLNLLLLLLCVYSPSRSIYSSARSAKKSVKKKESRKVRSRLFAVHERPFGCSALEQSLFCSLENEPADKSLMIATMY